MGGQYKIAFFFNLKLLILVIDKELFGISSFLQKLSSSIRGPVDHCPKEKKPFLDGFPYLDAVQDVLCLVSMLTLLIGVWSGT